MILNIRGTSGSGKSTVVRQVMKLYDKITKVIVDGRKQPLWYLCEAEGRPHLAVLGHYETPCGGCDTISRMDDIYTLIRERHEAGMDVLFEGLLLSPECNRTIALHTDGIPLVVLQLQIPLQECIDSVNLRRWTKNPNAGEVNPKNTEAKWKQTKRSIERLEGAGVTCFTGNREQTLGYAEQVLEL